MWYKITWSLREFREQLFTELIFAYEDELLGTLAAKLSVSNEELVIIELEKYSIKEGTC